MIKPATLNLIGGRWEPFVYKIALQNVNLTGATLLMQVRLTYDASGTPLISLVGASASAQGLSFSVDTSGAEPVSTIQIRINETTMEGLPLTGEVGDDAVFYYDLQITRPGVHDKVRYFRGTFTAQAGATQ